MTDLLVRPKDQETMWDDNLVRVFVYGTLRVGHGNYEWAKSAVVHVQENVTTPGRIYFVWGRNGYPVAKFDREGRIVGDILWFDPTHPDFKSVVRMELGAGYVTKVIKVSTDDGEVECLGFDYVRDPEGAWIKSGDWASEI